MAITQWLSESDPGLTGKENDLYSNIYHELHKIAHNQLQKMWSLDTLCTTALVNEAYLKLLNIDRVNIKDRNHFFAIAAKAMRQFLINYAEQKQCQKRGGDWQRVTQNDAFQTEQYTIETLLAIHYALNDLKSIDSNLCELVELRFFGGMTEQEVADLHQVSTRTIRRNWKKARALLMHAME